jgi:hypothetical protein
MEIIPEESELLKEKECEEDDSQDDVPQREEDI